MDRDELKSQIDDLMQQYDKEEIDGEDYLRKMMELTSRAKEENESD